VTIAADGTFIYTPKANPGAAASTSDSFTYTVSSNTGGTSPVTSAAATVNLSLSNRVWYVKNNGGGSNGQSQSPFTTLAAAGAASTANDFIFVYNGDGTNTGQNAGITLKNGQQLLGEANGLSVGALTIAAGSRPTIGNAGGDGVTITNVTGVFVKGLAVAGSANAINMTSSGANTLTATVDNVLVNNAGTNGIRTSAASSGTSTVTVQNSTVSAATANGIDARTAAGAGTLLLNINNDVVTATGNGIVIDGSAAGTTTITGFANNSVGGNTGSSGIVVTSATFDATPSGTFQTVSGGTTSVGASGNGVGVAGMVLTNVSGDLSFTDLDIFTSAGAGLQASGTTPYTGSAGFQIAVGAGVATITAVGGPAVNLTTVRANNLPFVTISSTGSPTTGVALNSLLGTFSAGSGSSISGSTGTGFQVGSSNATISYDGTINTTVGKGVDLTTNTGSTISFTGAMTMSSGANTAFNATGGGTVSATNTASTLTSTTGTALNVANTTIGAGGLKFQSITAGTAASGPTNGIVLNTTGTSGSLVVSGTGSASSGGTIQKTGAEGILITGPADASFAWMSIQNPGTHGISSTTARNLTITNTTITDAAGSNTTDDGIHAINTSGTLTLTGDTVNGGRHQGITIDNFNTNMAALSMMSTTVTNTPGGDGVLMQMRGTSILTSGVVGAPGTGNTFSNNSATGFQSNTVDTGNIQSLTIANNTFAGNNAGADLDLSPTNTNMSVTVQNNTFNNHHTTALNLVAATGVTGGTLSATLRSNIIGTQGTLDSGSAIGTGIRIANGGNNVFLTIDSNIIREVPNGRGIDVEPQAYVPNLTLKAKIINNQIVRPSGTNQNIGCGANVPCPTASVFVLADNNAGGFSHACTVITGNTAYDPTSYPAGGEAAFYMARRTTTSNTLQLEGNTGLSPSANILGTNTVTNLTAAGFFDEGAPTMPVVVVAAGTCGAFPP